MGNKKDGRGKFMKIDVYGLFEGLTTWEKVRSFFSLVFIAISAILICWAVGIKVYPEILVLPDISSNLHRVIVLLFALLFAVLGGYGISLLRPPPVPTLKVFTGLAYEEIKVLKNIIEEIVIPKFEKAYKTTIKIELENIHSKDVPKRLKKRKSSADLITIDINGPWHELVRKGLIEDLSDGKCQGCLPSTTYSALRRHLEVNGKRYFMPFRTNVQIVFWNKEKFAEIEHPKTWEEVREVAKIFFEKEGKARVAIQAKDDVIHITLFQLIRSAGGDHFNLLDPHSKEALEFLRTLYPYVSPVSSEINWQTASGSLLDESIYLLRNWPFTVSFIHNAEKDNNFESYSGWSWRKDSKPVNLLGGEFLALPKNASHKELAKDLMKYLMSEEVQKKLVEELSWPPMRPVTGIPNWQKHHQKVIKEAIEYAEPLPENWLPDMPGIYKETFDKIVNLDPSGDIESILAESQEKIDAALAGKPVQQ